MGTFYTDEQIQVAIAALEDHTPGIWERMKKMALTPNDAHDEGQEIGQGAIVRVLTIVLPKVSFVAQAQDRFEARARLSIDLGGAARCNRIGEGRLLDQRHDRFGSQAAFTSD